MKKIYIYFRAYGYQVDNELYDRMRKIGKEHGYIVVKYVKEIAHGHQPDAVLKDIFPIEGFYPDSLIHGFFVKQKEKDQTK